MNDDSINIRSPKDEWPVDRNFERLDSKLGPFKDYGEWQRKRSDNYEERLEQDGTELAFVLNDLNTLLMDYDMTIEEAVKCLEYELEKFDEDS